jgi:hypothetical protein
MELRKQHREIGLMTLVASVASPFLFLLASIPIAATHQRDATKVVDAFSCSSLLTAASTYSIVSSFYNQTNGSSSWSSRSTVASSAWSMFNTACNTTAFQVLAQGPGAGNFGVEMLAISSGGSSTPSVGGPSYSNYTFDWQQGNSSAPLADEEWWSGNLSSGHVIGPFINTAIRSMWNGGKPSKMWSGYEWWAPSASNASLPAILTSESAWTKIIPFSVPVCSSPPTNCQSNVSAGTTIDPVGVVWTGLNNTSGKARLGMGTLLQTGYVYDAANPSASWCTANKSGCDYGLYWELSPSMAYAYNGAPDGILGDTLREEVFNTVSPTCIVNGKAGTYWATEIDDLGPSLPRSVLHAVCLPEFMPLYAPMIYDSPYLQVAGHWHYQQTPQFSHNTPIVFQSGYVARPGTPPTLYPVVTLWGNTPPGYYKFTMNEKLANPNTNESFVYPCGSSYLGGVSRSCQIIEWINSNYDYTYV